MWIFTQKGFLSIVRHIDKANILIVRSRFKGHIERVFPKARVEEDATRDYRFRAELPIEEVSKMIANMVSQIDYHNFKDSLSDEIYFESCVQIYNLLAKNSIEWDSDNLIIGRSREIPVS